MLGLPLQEFRRRILPTEVLVGGLFAVCGIGAPHGTLDEVEIQFRDHHLHAERAEGDERALNLFEGDAVELQVELHADPVDAQPARLQVLDQTDGLLALVRVFVAVVVEVELGIRIGLAREREGVGDVVVADDLLPAVRAQVFGGLVGDALVHDVPALDPPAVAADRGLDVRAQTRQQSLA